MNCEACHKNEATCHLTFLLGQQQHTKHLCGECYAELGNPAEQAFLKAAPGKACDYCGNQPCFVGTDIIELCLGRQKPRFLCESCVLEFNRALQQETASLSAGGSLEEKRASLEGLHSRLADHMKRWSAQKTA